LCTPGSSGGNDCPRRAFLASYFDEIVVAVLFLQPREDCNKLNEVGSYLSSGTQKAQSYSSEVMTRLQYHFRTSDESNKALDENEGGF